ncbi:dolichyl-diphosphooligosaccharide--protein glycosyltransferase subunit 2-like [Halichondria panicea]|uniref:dolichyl-diphosphooligosaccharide--protein glycosyltransferase subunit 2-like n=1 Tax=Halichondria panicea TaxID=6063 RepID=UPI00312BB81D
MCKEMEQSRVLIGFLLLLSVCWACHGAASSLEDVITQRDKTRLLNLFKEAEPYEDVETPFFLISGLQVIGYDENNKHMRNSACTMAKAKEYTELRDIFYSTSIAAMLKGCTLKDSPKRQKVLTDTLGREATVEELYYAITSMANQNMPIDNETAPAALLTALENEDTPFGYAQAFLAASVISDADLTELSNQIEDVVAQADESPNTLYYEGGIKVTSAVIRGIFALSARVGEKPDLTEVQATKFGNYLVSSKFTSSVADAASMLSASKALATNNAVIPAALLLDGGKPISEKNKNLDVQLTNILSGQLDQFTVKIKSITNPTGEKTNIDKPMTAGANKISFTYNIFGAVNTPGVHSVVLSTESKATSPAVVLSNIELSVTVSFEVTVGTAQLAVMDKDQRVTTKSLTLEYPNTSKDSVEADQHSKLRMTFTLLNQINSEPVVVHQAFVRLTSGQQEIFFVATPDNNKEYTFELDVAESAKEFSMSSGTYTLTLIVGDFALENPFSWNVGSVGLKFPSPLATTDGQQTAEIYKAKPAIEHLFRLPEKRPPLVVSSTFTILVLAPLGVLLILWAILGANISNIGAGGIWTILFHLGLGGILGLYYCFWTQLNMFQTLKYLVALGVFTFFTGNKMLRNIAKAKQA